jgi:hypothetical protein
MRLFLLQSADAAPEKRGRAGLVSLIQKPRMITCPMML